MLLAAGCATVPPADHAPAIERRYHDAITLSGRLSIRHEQDRREQAVHGSFIWQQSAHHIVLELLSPLGQTLATIDIQPDLAVLTQSGKTPLAAANVDVLTERALGWPLPVSGLRDWLQGFGRNADGQAFIAQPSSDTVRYITSDGWHLSYGEWQDKAANTTHNRPKRIDLARHTRQAGPVSIRIVIDQWESQ